MYDTARVGSAALLPTFKRVLSFAELAHWLGFCYSSIYNYWDKYFDIPDIEAVMTQAKYNEFPLPQLASALMQHVSPRVIQTNGCSSKSVPVHECIVAGCRCSFAVIGTYATRDIEQRSEEYPDSHPEMFVSDICIRTVGVCIDDVMIS